MEHLCVLHGGRTRKGKCRRLFHSGGIMLLRCAGRGICGTECRYSRFGYDWTQRTCGCCWRYDCGSSNHIVCWICKLDLKALYFSVDFYSRMERRVAIDHFYQIQNNQHFTAFRPHLASPAPQIHTSPRSKTPTKYQQAEHLIKLDEVLRVLTVRERKQDRTNRHRAHRNVQGTHDGNSWVP